MGPQTTRPRKRRTTKISLAEREQRLLREADLIDRHEKQYVRERMMRRSLVGTVVTGLAFASAVIYIALGTAVNGARSAFHKKSGMSADSHSPSDDASELTSTSGC